MPKTSIFTSSGLNLGFLCPDCISRCSGNSVTHCTSASHVEVFASYPGQQSMFCFAFSVLCQLSVLWQLTDDACYALNCVMLAKQQDLEKGGNSFFEYVQSSSWYLFIPCRHSISSQTRVSLREFLLKPSLCCSLCYLAHLERKAIPDMFQPDFMVFDWKVQQGERKTIVYLNVEHKPNIILHSGDWSPTWQWKSLIFYWVLSSSFLWWFQKIQMTWFTHW